MNLPTEMLPLHTTSLTLVITDGVGDQPIRATGLVMVHLETIVSQMSKKPRIWMLRPSAISAKRSWDYLNRIAKKHTRGRRHTCGRGAAAARTCQERSAEGCVDLKRRARGVTQTGAS